MSAILEKIEIDGAMFDIPFYFSVVDGKEQPVAFAQDIGKFFYDTEDERKAAKSINKLVSNNIEFFDEPGLRTGDLKSSLDGKQRKSWAYTKEGVARIGLLTRSRRGKIFCIAAARVMVKLMEGKTVSLKKPEEPLSPAHAFLQMAQNMVAFEEEQKQQRAAIEEVKKGQHQLSNTVVTNQEAIASLHRKVENNHIRSDEITARALAKEMGILSESGNPHFRGVIAVAKSLNFIGRGLARYADSPSGDGHSDPIFAFTLKGYDVFRVEFAELAFDKGQSFTLRALGKNNKFVLRDWPGKS